MQIDHPSERRSRAVSAAERGAELSGYETFGIVCTIDRATESMKRARSHESRLRLKSLVAVLHDILMRGEEPLPS
jgi:hypothetical protein